MEEQLTFSTALVLLKDGKRLQRAGWNGKNMYVAMMTPDVDSGMTEPYLFIRTPTGQKVPWVTSQMDVLAEDWSEAT